MTRETREVLIEWDDEKGVTYLVTVVVDGEWTDGEDDDNIFFYFRTLAELEDAKNGGAGLDFRIVEVCDEV
jgi:hypothetical protein